MLELFLHLLGFLKCKFLILSLETADNSWCARLMWTRGTWFFTASRRNTSDPVSDSNVHQTGRLQLETWNLEDLPGPLT